MLRKAVFRVGKIFTSIPLLRARVYVVPDLKLLAIFLVER